MKNKPAFIQQIENATTLHIIKRKNNDGFYDIPSSTPLEIKHRISLKHFSNENLKMRSLIFFTFSLHKEKLLKSILKINNSETQLSRKDYNHQDSNYSNKNIYNLHYDIFQPTSNTSIDIIESYAFFKKITYKESTIELFNHIKNNKIYTTGKKQITAELNPINIPQNSTYENFFDTIKNITKKYLYKNIFNNIIGYNIYYSYKNYSNSYNLDYTEEVLSIFYSIYRIKKSTIPFLLPNYPYQKVMFFNIENACKHEEIYVVKDESVVENLKYHSKHNVISMFIQNEYKFQADFTPLANKTLIFDVDVLQKYNKTTIYKIANLLQAYNTKCFLLKEGQHKPHLDTTADERIDLHHQPIPSAFSEVNAPIANSARVRKEILHPIIKSGTITWLFAKEKTGKTLLALTLAYMTGKGNKIMYTWSTSSPKKVLYIDGEMSGDSLNNLFQKIRHGFGDHDSTAPPFATYLFSEDETHYNSILDRTWIERYKEKLFSYDLIVLDNYHSLNENKINIKAFLKLLRELKQRDIAILVVDHTNKEGELQGSISKRRAADLGLKVESTSKSKIKITYEFDRHGVGIEEDAIHLEKIFTDTSFTFSPYEQIKIQSPQTQLSEHVKLQLYCYALREYHDMPLAELEKIIAKSQSTISNYHKSTVDQLNGIVPPRNKLRNLELAKDFLTDIKDMTKEQTVESLSKYACSQVRDF